MKEEPLIIPCMAAWHVALYSYSDVLFFIQNLSTRQSFIFFQKDR